MQLTIKGGASQRSYLLEVLDGDLAKTLLNFLREKDISVASSCRGERICHMCVVNEDILSCSITVSDYMFKYGNFIKISYL